MCYTPVILRCLVDGNLVYYLIKCLRAFNNVPSSVLIIAAQCALLSEVSRYLEGGLKTIKSKDAFSNREKVWKKISVRLLELGLKSSTSS